MYALKDLSDLAVAVDLPLILKNGLEREKQNTYLEEHPRAHLKVELRKIKEYSRKLRISKWIMLSVSERKIFITVDQSSLDE